MNKSNRFSDLWKEFWEIALPDLQFMWSLKVVLIRYGVVTPILIAIFLWLA